MFDKNEILYTFGKSYHISHNQDFFCCVGSSVHLYDFNNGKSVYNFKNIKNPSCSEFMPDKNLIVKTTTGHYYVYDLVSMNLIKKILLSKGMYASTADFKTTSDNKYIIDFSYIFPISKLMITYIETKEHILFDIGNSRGGCILKTESNSKYYVVTKCAEMVDSPDISTNVFYELTYKSGQFKLKELFSEKGRFSLTDYCSNRFACADYSNKITIFDIEKNIKDKFEYNSNDVLYDLKLSKSGNLIALAESQNIYIYDLKSKKNIKTYDVDYGCFVGFLDNDTKLLVGTWEKGYCVSL